MAEAKSRREPAARTRVRTKSDSDDGTAPGEEDGTSFLTGTEMEPETELTSAEADSTPVVETVVAPPVEEAPNRSLRQSRRRGRKIPATRATASTRRSTTVTRRSSAAVRTSANCSK